MRVRAHATNTHTHGVLWKHGEHDENGSLTGAHTCHCAVITPASLNTTSPALRWMEDEKSVLSSRRQVETRPVFAFRRRSEHGALSRTPEHLWGHLTSPWIPGRLGKRSFSALSLQVRVARPPGCPGTLGPFTPETWLHLESRAQEHTPA